MKRFGQGANCIPSDGNIRRGMITEINPTLVGARAAANVTDIAVTVLTVVIIDFLVVLILIFSTLPVALVLDVGGAGFRRVGGVAFQCRDKVPQKIVKARRLTNTTQQPIQRLKKLGEATFFKLVFRALLTRVGFF